jgi:glycosyltransferase involved in cell wall biosynthesis
MDKKSKSMKTLVYILPDKDAGVASVVRNLLRFKTNRYATKVLLLHNLLDNSKRRVKDDYNADEIVRVTYNGKWSSKNLIYKKITKQLDENSIVISNDGGIELAAAMCIKHPISVAYILHGDIKHYYQAIQKHQNCIGTIVTVSDFLKDKLEAINTEVVIKSIKFPVPNANTLNRTVDTSKIRLVFVGSLISAKGIFDLEPILTQLEYKNIPFSLNIIGSGAEEQQLKTALSKYETVFFKGKLPNEDVLELHNNHDVILLPSKTEGLPVVLVEAMKYGVVPMATKLESGIPEIIENNANGFMVALDSMSNYTDHIEQLHNNRSQLKKMSDLCIAKAEVMFSPYQQAKAYEDAFVNAKSTQSKIKKHILDYFPITIAHRLKSYFSQ